MPTPYSGQAGGDVADVGLTVGALTLADVRLANSDSAVDSTATLESRNLAALVAGLGITVEETSQPSATQWSMVCCCWSAAPCSA